MRKKLLLTCSLAELIDNQEFQRDHLEESMAVFSITMEIRTFNPHFIYMKLESLEFISMNWIAEKESS
jgi:hypothetical protein